MSVGETSTLYSEQDPDYALVQRAQEELPYRTQAFEELMLRHQKLILRICLKMLDGQSDAEDVSQEVMLKIFHALPGFEARSTFKTWLSRIATNTCINSYDKIKRSNEMRGLLADDPTIKRDVEMCTAKHDINKAMTKLDLKDRQLLTLRYVSDLKIDEIADISGLGLSAAKMRLYRAQENLAAIMKAS